ncbi:MAG: hypothetical protein QW321_02605, partial [Candidatus Aenigmatarchaeota archaeon]
SFPHDKLDFQRKQHAYLLNEKYRFINLSKDEKGRTVWVPNRFDSFFSFNRNLKRILEIEKAPTKILKIVEMWEKILFEEKRKIEEFELRFALKT